MNLIEAKLNAEGIKTAIVAARFNEFISSKLVEGAVDALKRHGMAEKNIDLVWVPGAFEIPLTAKKLAANNNYDGVIALGAVIRGETPHFDYVAAEVSKGVAKAGLDSEKPIIFGVLTTETIEQAISRAGTKAGNKGYEAAVSLIEMVNLFKKLDEKE